MTMGNFAKCRDCGEYGFIGASFMQHRCKPAWECRMAWEDDDCWTKVHGLDAEEAAKKCAEMYDRDGGEYAIVGNRMSGDVIVLVRKPGSEKIERWSIEAEAVPQYRAYRADER